MSGIALDDFVAEAKRFLDANAEPRSEQRFVWGEGPDRVGILDEKTPDEEAEELRAAKDWKAREFDAGFGWITGPEEYGGRALDAAYQRAYAATQSNYAIASVSPFAVGLGMVAPTILAHAIPEVKERYLRSLYRGDLVACQLFSEPAAGSDLAGIQTRAARDGDEWVISGQKVWTSGAQQSDLGEVITRASVDQPKHKGLTMLLVDMKAPGVTVRPLRQMTGGASFNEVFFDEVRVHDSHRLGDVDEGWTVALTTLMNERAAIGGGGGGVGGVSFTRFKEMAIHFGLDENPIVRQHLADIYIRLAAPRDTNLRALDRGPGGQRHAPVVAVGARLLAHAPASGRLWWLCAGVVAGSDAAEAARAAERILESDRTPSRLASLLPFPHDDVIAVLGWPEIAGRALVERP